MQWNQDGLVRPETIHQNDVKTKYWWNTIKILAATVKTLQNDYENLANKDNTICFVYCKHNSFV